MKKRCLKKQKVMVIVLNSQFLVLFFFVHILIKEGAVVSTTANPLRLVVGRLVNKVERRKMKVARQEEKNQAYNISAPLR